MKEVPFALRGTSSLAAHPDVTLAGNQPEYRPGIADSWALRNGRDCTIIVITKRRQAWRRPGKLPGDANRNTGEEANGR